LSPLLRWIGSFRIPAGPLDIAASLPPPFPRLGFGRIATSCFLSFPKSSSAPSAPYPPSLHHRLPDPGVSHSPKHSHVAFPCPDSAPVFSFLLTFPLCVFPRALLLSFARTRVLALFCMFRFCCISGDLHVRLSPCLPAFLRTPSLLNRFFDDDGPFPPA